MHSNVSVYKKLWLQSVYCVPNDQIDAPGPPDGGGHWWPRTSPSFYNPTLGRSYTYNALNRLSREFTGNITQICRICGKIPWHYAGGCVPKKRTIYGHINLPSSSKDIILEEFWVLLLRKGGNFKKRMQECCFLFVKLHLVQYCFSPALGWFRCAHLYFKDFHIVPNDK